MVKMQE